jgi:hypothetical protein
LFRVIAGSGIYIVVVDRIAGGARENVAKSETRIQFNVHLASRIGILARRDSGRAAEDAIACIEIAPSRD